MVQTVLKIDKLKMVLVCLVLAVQGYAGELDDMLMACKKDTVHCCKRLGKYYFTRAVKTDKEWYRIQETLHRLCIKRDDKCACFMLGNHYKSQENNSIQAGIESWKQKAYYLEKACNLGESKACNNLGVLYKRKWWRRKYYPIEVNLTKALYYFTLACDSEDAIEKGCANKEETIEMLKEQK